MKEIVAEPPMSPQEEVFPEGYTNLAFIDSDNPKEEPLPVETSPKPKKQGLFRKKKTEDPEDDVKTIGFFQLFRYATPLEIILIMVGILCSAVHGIALPCMVVVFGKTTDSFVASGKRNNVTTANFTVDVNSSECIQEPGMDIEAMITMDINTVKEGLGGHLSIFVQLMCTVLAGMIIGFVHGWKLTLVILSAFPLLAGSSAVWSKVLISLNRKELSAYAKAGAVAEEVLVSIRTVMAFNGQKKAAEKYETNLEDAKKSGIKKAVITKLLLGLSRFCLFGTHTLGFWYGTKLTLEEPETYSIGTVLTVFFAVLIGISSFGEGIQHLEAVLKAQSAASEIYHTIDKPRPIDCSSKEGHKLDSVKGDIEFKDIHFSYPSRRDTKILNGMSLKIPHGKTVALVGASGCGKSTTIQLLQRFYDPDGGEVLLDGHNVRSLNIRWLRENMGIVSQEPVLFSTTIAQNIRYGREDATDQEIEQAVRDANAYDFISNLPDKLNTVVGERGAQLSGGQKQRIAIARALVKNPKILLLDEATSALDTQSEATVQAALDKARAGRTTIVIAHRLSTIRTADIIAGFDKGVVKELGTHRELMNLKGIYYSLVMQQSSGEDCENESSEGGTFDESSDEWNEDQTLEENTIFARMSLRRRSSLKKSRKKCKKCAKIVKREEDPVPDIPLAKIFALSKPEWPYLLCGTLSSIVDGAIFPCAGILVAKIIGVFSEMDPEVRRERTMMFSLFFLLVGGVAFVTASLQACTFGISGELLTRRLRSQSFSAMLRQEIGWFDDRKNSVGVLMTKLATDASLVKGAAESKLSLDIYIISALTVALVVAFIHCWQLSLLLLGCLPLLSGGRIRTAADKSLKEQKALELSGKISTEAVENIRTVAALSLEDVFYHKFMSSLTSPHRLGLHTAPIDGLTYGLFRTFPFFIRAAVFRLGAWLIAHCYTEYEDVFLVLTVIIYASLGIGKASSSSSPNFTKSKAAAQRVLALLMQMPKIDIYREDGVKLNDCGGNIEFRGIQFAYPTRPKAQVLQGFNVSVGPGQTLALVGGSGCGKSTSIQLLERFYDPAAGRVYLDGQDIKTLNLGWLRSQMGLVSQEPTLFNCTIAENIQYGDNSRPVSQDEIEDAAKSANIHNYILSLPEKYNTRVGDKGTQLSGGQKQRIAIARALVRRPKILLLDEATSALDTESERIVQKALDNARLGRTCIVIAHRLSTVQNADIIAVIKNGMVIEQGTHGQLMANRGAYYALVNAQKSH